MVNHHGGVYICLGDCRGRLIAFWSRDLDRKMEHCFYALSQNHYRGVNNETSSPIQTLKRYRQI